LEELLKQCGFRLTDSNLQKKKKTILVKKQLIFNNILISGVSFY
jgi:hypothetical protein